ncbi:YegP family protein [Halobiforma nitratireducens]|nr:YegP family protein [Halobiforma nitratireducens]
MSVPRSGRRESFSLFPPGPASSTVAITSSGTVAGIQWGEQGLEVSVGVAVLIGVVLFASVGAAVFALAKRNGRFDGDGVGNTADPARRDDASDGAVARPSLLTDGTAGEGVEIALFRDGDDWGWRLFHLEAVGEGASHPSTRATASERVERIREAIATARIREVPADESVVRVYEDRDGNWQWDFVRADGRCVGTNAVDHDQRGDAIEAASVLQDRGPDADCIDVERAAFSIAQHPDGWHWQLVDEGREPIVTSTDGYETRTDAADAAERFADEVVSARLLEAERLAVELYERGRQKRRDRGQEPTEGATTGDGTATRDGSGGEEGSNGGEDSNGEDNEDDLESETGCWSWRLVDGTDVIADARTDFETRDRAERAATTVLSELEEAAVTVAGRPAYERYRTEDGWRWRLVDATGRVVARAPAESSEAAAERAVEQFAEGAPAADVREVEGAAYEVYPATDCDVPTGTSGPLDRAGVGATGPTVDSDAAGGFDAGGGDGAKAGADGQTRADLEAETEGTMTDGAGLEGDEPAEYGAPSERSRNTSSSVREGTSDGWRWRLVTDEREVIAASPRAYADAEIAQRVIERIRTQAGKAAVIEFENAAFRVYESDAGEWRWRLLDERGRVLADSGADHDSRSDAAEAMVTLKEQAPDADVREIETAAFELYAADDTERNGEAWSWRLIDSAGRRVATAPATYPAREDARAAMERARERLGAEHVTMDEPIFQPRSHGDWSWWFVRPSGDVLAVSGEDWTTRDELRADLADLRETAADAHGYATGAVTAQLRCGDAWRWRLLDRDRDPIVDSVRAYDDRGSARRAVGELERTAADATIFAADEPLIRPERADDSGDGGVDADGNGAERGREGEGSHAPADGWRWVFLDRDRNRLAVAADRRDRTEIADAVDDVRRLASQAGTIQVTGPSFDFVADDAAVDTGPGTERGDDSDEGWRWRLLDGECRPIAIEARGNDSKTDARAAFEDARALLEAARIVELEEPTFELYAMDAAGDNASCVDADEESGDVTDGNGDGDGSGGTVERSANNRGVTWGWRLVDERGTTLLESTKRYESRADAHEALTAVRSYGPDGTVTTLD